MRAWQLSELGEPVDVLRLVEVEVPAPPPGFVTVRTLATAANFPDVLPRNEGRLSEEVMERYGADRSIDEIAEAWKPFRSWAGVHLRALRALDE